MSGYRITAIDREALPADMLALAKTHMRVDFNDDDDYIKSCLRRAIDLFERYSGWMVFAAEVEWTPIIVGTCSVYECPVQPVVDFAVMSGGSDVSTGYAIRSTSMTEPYYLYTVDGSAFPGDTAVTLGVGYETLETLPPAVEDCTLRIAATLYQNRETVVLGSMENMPQWLNDLLVAVWIPRA